MYVVKIVNQRYQVWSNGRIFDLAAKMWVSACKS